MGILEDIDQLELSDEVKERMKTSARIELESKDEELDKLRSKDRREDVKAELADLKALGLSDPGILKYLRRVFLSADAEQPGAVLLGDTELGLSGDDATGHSGKQEVSVAGALREFIKLLPRNTKGKLDLGQMALADDATQRPEEGDVDDPQKKREEVKESSENWLGRPIERKRERYSARGRRAAATGGGS